MCHSIDILLNYGIGKITWTSYFHPGGTKLYTPSSVLPRGGSLSHLVQYGQENRTAFQSDCIGSTHINVHGQQILDSKYQNQQQLSWKWKRNPIQKEGVFPLFFGPVRNHKKYNSLPFTLIKGTLRVLNHGLIQLNPKIVNQYVKTEHLRSDKTAATLIPQHLHNIGSILEVHGKRTSKQKSNIKNGW